MKRLGSILLACSLLVFPAVSASYGAYTISQLTDNSYDDRDSEIGNGGHVVWQGSDGSDWEIFLHAGTTTTQLTDNSYNDQSPRTNVNGHVAWQGSWNIMWPNEEIFLP
jgi:hypothetical protein